MDKTIKRLSLVIVLAVLLSGCSSNSNNKISDYMKSADQSYQSGKYDKAIDEYNEVIKLDDEYVDAYINKARCEIEKGNLVDAKELLKNAKKIEEKPNANYKEVEGIIYWHENKLDKAISSFNEAIKLDDSSTLYSNRGQVYYKQNKLIEAKKDIKKSIELDKHIEINYYILAQISIEEKNYSEANKYSTMGKEINTKDARTIAILGYSELMLIPDTLSKEEITIKQTEAFKKLEQANMMDSKEAEVYNYMGLFQYQLGNYQKSIEYYNLAIELNSNNAVFFNNRSLSYYHLKDNQRARNDINKAIELDNTDPEYYLARGYILVSERNDNEAIIAFKEAVKLDEKYLERIPDYLVKVVQEGA